MCVLSRAQKRCSRTNGTNGCVTASMGGAAGLQGQTAMQRSFLKKDG
jgi:hypothetical protein